VPHIAENIAYFGKGMDSDLSLEYNTEEGALDGGGCPGICLVRVLEYLNLIATYMLHALAGSQSMGKLLHAFKNVRSTPRSSTLKVLHHQPHILEKARSHQTRRR
jgi:hypothetical protein